MKPTTIEWFRYDSFSYGEGLTRPAPILQVVVESAGRVRRVHGLVDSGSEISCLPSAIARALGYQLSEDTEDVLVFGATVKARKAIVNMRIATSAGVPSFPGAECSVPDTEVGVNFAVLGREPLFGEVEVRFQDWLQRFGLQRRRAFLQRDANPRGPAPRATLATARRRSPALHLKAPLGP